MNYLYWLQLMLATVTLLSVITGKLTINQFTVLFTQLMLELTILISESHVVNALLLLI